MGVLPAGTSAGSARYTAAALVLASVLMFGFGYAMIPLYYKICRLLGIETVRSLLTADDASDSTAASAGRPFRMEFDTNASAAVLTMKPSLRVADMKTGTAFSVVYELVNLTDRTITGRAVPSYAPAAAGLWLKKLQCFCFNDITLTAGEHRKEPVVLVLDNRLPAEIEVVSMSYTFHERKPKT